MSDLEVNPFHLPRSKIIAGNSSLAVGEWVSLAGTLKYLVGDPGESSFYALGADSIEDAMRLYMKEFARRKLDERRTA